MPASRRLTIASARQAGSGQRTSDDRLPHRASISSSPSIWRNSKVISASLPAGATRRRDAVRAAAPTEPRRRRRSSPSVLRDLARPARPRRRADGPCGGNRQPQHRRGAGRRSDICDDSTAKCGRTAAARCGSRPRSARAARPRPGTRARRAAAARTRGGASRRRDRGPCRGRGSRPSTRVRRRRTWAAVPMFVTDGCDDAVDRDRGRIDARPAAAARCAVARFAVGNPSPRPRPSPRTTVPSMK